MTDIAPAGAELAQRTRRSQGLPTTIEEPSAIADIAALAAGSLKRAARTKNGAGAGPHQARRRNTTTHDHAPSPEGAAIDDHST